MEKVYENNNILFKILPCLLIALYLIMCLFGSTVCAYDVTYNDNTYTLNDEISNFKYIATIQLDNYVYILCSDNPFVFFTEDTYSDGSPIWRIGYPEHDSKFYYISVWWTNISKIPSYTLSDFSETIACSSTFSIPKNWTEANHATSSFDLKDKDGNVVFQGASPELAGVTIPAIQSAEEIPQAIIKTMKVVIPVGLVILGIGLVIYLIKSVILRMQ